MVLTYMMAQLIPMRPDPATNKPSGGFMIVFGVYNVDQALLGFTTKYDTSSGDINPIGTLNHSDVMHMLEWFDKTLKWSSLQDTLAAEPKYVPPTFGQEQEDVDFSLTWNEVETLSKFRNERNCGPFSMFDNLAEFWPDFDLEQLYDTVVLFFDTYSRNRHKSIIQTPALYLSNHSCDSNKFNYTPHIYNGFEYQYKKMKALKESIQMANLAKLHKDTNIRHAQTGTIRHQSKHKEGTEKDDHHHDDAVGPNPFDFAQKEKGIGRQVEMQSNESMSVDK
jgi:NAD+ synthase (glutamine-hydrolysing)